MSTKWKTIKVIKKNRVAYLTLNRPEALNALSPELLKEVKNAVGQVRDDQEIKALVITGEGRAFCAGADLKYLGSRLFEETPPTEDEFPFNEALAMIDEFPLPVIAKVDGFAFAGGLELLLACDMAIASEEAKIGDQHQNRGLVGGPVQWQLPLRVGLQKAMEISFTGRWLTGREAEEYGIVLKAVPRERLDEELENLLSQLRDKSRSALISNKRGLKECMKEHTFRDGARVGNSLTQAYVRSADFMEGVKAFLEKRQAKFD